MDDQLMDVFMLAVYEIGKQNRGRAVAGQIMPHLGLDPNNLTNADDSLYMRVARRCEEWGFIEKEADRYQVVRITEIGKEYVERPMEL